MDNLWQLPSPSLASVSETARLASVSETARRRAYRSLGPANKGPPGCVGGAEARGPRRGGAARVGVPPQFGQGWASRCAATAQRGPGGCRLLWRADGCRHLRAGPERGAKGCGRGRPRLTGDGKRGPGHRAGDAAGHLIAQHRQQQQREMRPGRRPGARAGPRARGWHLWLRLAAGWGALYRFSSGPRKRWPCSLRFLLVQARPARGRPGATRLRPFKGGPMAVRTFSSSQSRLSGAQGWREEIPNPSRGGATPRYGWEFFLRIGLEVSREDC